MHSRNLLISLCAPTTCALFLGCSEIPRPEVEAAKTSLEAARNAEAGLYAPEQLNAASVALDSALLELDRQNRAFALARSYSRCVALLKDARSAANNAEAEAARKKERMRMETDTILKSAQVALEEARTLAKEVSMRGRTVPQEFMAELDAAVSLLSQASASLGTGDVISGHRSARVALEKVYAAKDSIVAIPLAQSRTKPGRS